MITLDRAQARHYGDERGRQYAVSQVLSALHGEQQWGTQEQMDRGTDVHRLFALSVAAYAGLCAPPTIPERYAGYLVSGRKWLDIAKPELIAIEQRRVSTIKGAPFAGTFDLLCWLYDKGRRVRMLVDVKSGVKERWHRVQVQAYGKLVPEANKLALLYLDKDGGLPLWYIVKPDARDWAGFQSALNVLIYRETT